MSRKSGLLGGLAVIALVNGVILGGVAWNRSGEPKARIELTERELDITKYLGTEEDSGLFLRPQRGDHSVRFREIESWFGREKLRELGFDVRVDPADPKALEFYENVLAREGFVVLQMDGDAWRRKIAQQERELREMRTPETERWRIDSARENLESARRMGSRLIPVDAGLDPERLRVRYPASSRYLVLPATFYLRHHRAEMNRPARLIGDLSDLLVDEIYAPLELRPLLEEVRRRREVEERQWQRNQWKEEQRGGSGEPLVQTPLYRATISFGRRYEPRLERVEPITP